MISKELLGEVLDMNIISIGKKNKQFLSYWYGEGYESIINIYELAHKCKEWAVEKGFDIDIKNTKFDNYIDIYHPDKRRLFTNAKSEPEAIFKACEWILEQQK